MKFLSTKNLVITAILVISLFIGVSYIKSLSKPTPSNKIKNNGQTNDSFDLAKADNGNVKITQEKKNVGINFIYNNKELMTANVKLYTVTKKNDIPVSIKADGNLLKDMVDELAIPQTENHNTAKVATVNGLDKIIDGEPMIGIDKEKTLKELENMTRTKSDESEFNVIVHTKTFADGGRSQIMEKMGFSALVASFTTTHPGHIDDVNRNVNLSIASHKIDGVILKPGDLFSFNKVVGNRTKANGFKDAGVIQNGKVIPGIGGGICQVSTTLYRAILMAGVKIVERHNHSIYDGIEYAERGLDAAVAWGYKDFKFKNTLSIPLLLTSQSGDGWVSVQVYAEKQPFEKITLETRNEVKHPFSTEVKQNPNLPKGSVRIIQQGVVGYSVEAYRIITDKGITKEERLSKDRYLTYNHKEEVNR